MAAGTPTTLPLTPSCLYDSAVVVLILTPPLRRYFGPKQSSGIALSGYWRHGTLGDTGFRPQTCAFFLPPSLLVFSTFFFLLDSRSFSTVFVLSILVHLCWFIGSCSYGFLPSPVPACRRALLTVIIVPAAPRVACCHGARSSAIILTMRLLTALCRGRPLSPCLASPLFCCTHSHYDTTRPE